MKHTYRLYIGDDKYHVFKSYKVYWAMYCLFHDNRAMLRIFKFRYNVCLNNPTLIKMFFTQFDTIDTLKNKLDDLENKIKNNYLYL